MVELTERKLPRSLDAEMAVLGALLFDNEAFGSVPEELEPEHFYDPVHGKVFGLIREMIRAGRTADPITLGERLREDDGLKEIGGVDYLVSMADSPFPASAMRDYAVMVYDLAVRRDLIRIGGELAERAYDQDCDDTASTIIEATETDLHGLVKTSSLKSGPQAFSRTLEQSMARIADAYEGGFNGLRTGIQSLDWKLRGLRGGQLIVVMGDTGGGKSTVGGVIASNIAGQSDPDDPKVALTFSAEMAAAEHAERFVASKTGIPYFDLSSGQISERQFGEVREAMLRCQRLPWLIDDQPGLTMAQMMARARRLALNGKLACITIDHIGLYRAPHARGEFERVTTLIMDAKIMAMELDVPVIALCQLNRAVRNRDDQRPTLGDARQSGEIENSANKIIGVYREQAKLEREKPDPADAEAMIEWDGKYRKARNKMELHILKHREGPTGMVEVYCDIERAIIQDFEERRDAA